MNKDKFDKALAINDSIEVLKEIQLELLDANKCIVVTSTDNYREASKRIYLPSMLYERFRTWVENTREDLEIEFERV